MSESIVSLTTKMSDLTMKRKQVLDNAANVVVNVLILRSQKDQLGDNTVGEIETLLREFPEADRNEIKTTALVKLAMAGKFGVSSKKTDSSKSDYRGSIFDSRY